LSVGTFLIDMMLLRAAVIRYSKYVADCVRDVCSVVNFASLRMLQGLSRSCCKLSYILGLAGRVT